MAGLGFDVHVEATRIGLDVKPKDREWHAWVEIGGHTVCEALLIRAEHPYQAERVIVAELASKLQRALGYCE